ncbi:hypothetical protein GCM10027614_03910 [Micromonospora vulcania]
MRATVLRTQVSGAARRPGRLILTGLAVLVASFVVFGTVLVQQITERTTRDNLSGTPAATDLVIGDLDHEPPTVAALRQVGALPGVAEAVGRLTVGVSIGQGYVNLQADPGTGPLATVRLIEGSYPDSPGEIAVSPRTVERLGLSVGTVTSGFGGELTTPTRLTVTGVVATPDDGGYNAYAPGDVILAWGHLRALERIDLRVAPGEAAATVRQRAAAVVPADLPIRTGDEVRQAEANAAAEQVSKLFALVGMFVAVAVAAAALVVTSTFRIVFAQRMRQLALLRAVGASRATLVGALTAEGALTGLVAGVVGVTGALAVGYALPAILRASGRAVSSPGLPLAAAGAVVVGAVVLTVLAVLAPAFSAARVSRWRRFAWRASPPAGAASVCRAWWPGCCWSSVRPWPAPRRSAGCRRRTRSPTTRCRGCSCSLSPVRWRSSPWWPSGRCWCARCWPWWAGRYASSGRTDGWPSVGSVARPAGPPRSPSWSRSA